MLTHLNGYKREAVLAPLFKMLAVSYTHLTLPTT